MISWPAPGRWSRNAASVSRMRVASRLLTRPMRPEQVAAAQEASRLQLPPEDDLHLVAARGDDVSLAREAPQRERLEPAAVAQHIVRIQQRALADEIDTGYLVDRRVVRPVKLGVFDKVADDHPLGRAPARRHRPGEQTRVRAQLAHEARPPPLIRRAFDVECRDEALR